MHKVIPIWRVVVKEGRMLFHAKEEFLKYLTTIEGECQLTVKKWYKNRTDRENRYYWGVVVEVLRDFFGYTKDEMHDAVKWQFLKKKVEGKVPVMEALIAEMKKAKVPWEGQAHLVTFLSPYLDGLYVGVLPTIESTATKSTAEFEELMEEIRRWAATEHGVNVPLPNEASDYQEKA